MKKLIMVLVVLVSGAATKANEKDKFFNKIQSGVWSIDGGNDCQILFEKSVSAERLQLTVISNQSTRNECFHLESSSQIIGYEGSSYSGKCSSDGATCFFTQMGAGNRSERTGYMLTLLQNGLIVVDEYDCNTINIRECADPAKYSRNNSKASFKLRFESVNFNDVLANNFYTSSYYSSNTSQSISCHIAETQATKYAIDRCKAYRNGDIYQNCNAVITKTSIFPPTFGCEAHAKATPNSN